MAPGATTMVFSAAASTMMTAEPLGPGTVDHTVQSNVVGPQVRPQSLGRRVVAERRDEFDRGAGAGGGDRLIAALAAGRR